MTKGCQGARRVPTPFVTLLTSKAKNGACVKVAPTCTKGPALVCKDIKDLLQPKGDAYRALLVQRPWDPSDVQEHVDKLAKSGAFGREMSAQEELSPYGKAKECLAREISMKAKRLAAFAMKHGLSKDLGWQIQQDLEEIGMGMATLVPTAKEILLKLDIMGESNCSRWHRDNYIGRAVVSYNASGTQYVHNSNVEMSQLDHGGLNEHIVRDKSQVFNAGVGDILFMKGSQFPAPINGLVHKSPLIQWHADGTVVNRLLLKVDLN